MSTRDITRTILPGALGLIATGLVITAQAQSEPQGLYSARMILDADVHLASDPDTRVGAVDDILLGDDMAVHALVVQSGATLGLGGQEVVITNALYRLDTRPDEDGTTSHRVVIEASEEEFAALPHYDRDWQQQARERSREAWERTQEGAERAGDAISEALDNMTN